MPDREIAASVIESCRQGDRDAFRLLYETYKDNVYSACLYFFHGDAAEAADVTQEIFLKLFGSISGFRGESGFSTWLYRLVRNACLDATRRKKARSRVPEGVETSAPSHEGDLLNSMDAAQIQQAVSGLPAKYRMLVLLRYFEDMSYEELSGAMNCSMGTIASRLSRAHKMLSASLSPLRNRVSAGVRDV